LLQIFDKISSSFLIKGAPIPELAGRRARPVIRAPEKVFDTGKVKITGSLSIFIHFLQSRSTISLFLFYQKACLIDSRNASAITLAESSLVK
jgi:hypothetical protein